MSLYHHHHSLLKMLEKPDTEGLLPHTRSSFWRWTAIVTLALVYGSSLLLVQVNTLLANYSQVRQFREGDSQHAVKAEGGVPSLYSGDKTPLTFAAVRNGTFAPLFNTIQWIQTPDSLTADSGDYITVHNGVYTLKSLLHPANDTVLFDVGNTIAYAGTNYTIDTVEFSDNLQLALVGCNKVHNWRHSTFGAYFVFDVSTRGLRPVVDNIVLLSSIALAKWSPDSTKVAYVLHNNVYVLDVATFNTTQVTFDGGAQIFYGKPDWVYEEEVFESDSALWWSPASTHVMLLRSNDTSVPVYSIPYFAQNAPLNESAYPLVKDLKYPKAGYPNPIVDILVYDVKADKLLQMAPSDAFYNDQDISNNDRLITQVTWVGPSQAMVRVTNRESDLLKMFLVSCSTSVSSHVARFEDARGTNEWFEITHNMLYVPKSESRDNDGYIDVVGIDGYDHLAYFSPANSSEPKYVLTSGAWEVVDGPAAYDFVTDKVYFLSTEKSTIERHLYSVNLDGTNKTAVTDVSQEAWFDASFSKGARYLLLTYNGPDVPYQKLIDLHTNKQDVFTSNVKLKETLKDYEIPATNYGNVTLENGVTVNFKENLPLNFDPANKYPLLFFVYGGPGSQLVNKMFSMSFSAIISAELNAVVVTVDGRGTGFKGKEFRNVVHDNLGHFEVEDQIAAAQHWISRGFIDENRTAIWGWSYGGYMTLKTLERDAGQTFKYGMSVAPVTDWRLYDSIYTERYMHTPEGNEEGYETSRVSNVEGFKSVRKFLIMHGTGDDNVHFQNSLRLIDAFDVAGVENYNMYVFPDSDHGIRWHNAGKVVYDRLFGWLQLAFEGAFDDEEYAIAMASNGVPSYMDLFG